MGNSTSNILLRDIEAGSRAASWLKRSFEKCSPISLDAPLTEQQFDDYEALTSRFARLADILVQKLFRGIDRALLEQPGSVLDTIHRAEKRGLGDGKRMREIREIRNVIAHEYSVEDLREIFTQVYQATEELLKTFERTEKFAREGGLL